MSALNQVNTELGFARAFHVRDQVLIESEIWATDLNPGNFTHACRNIAGATDCFAPRLAEVSNGGLLRFDSGKTADYAGADSIGGYL